MTIDRKQLLEKYLSSECTTEELQLVKQLLDQPDTEDHLHELMIARSADYEAAIPDEALTEKVNKWETQVLQRIKATEEHTTIVRRIQPRKWIRYAAVAAGILISANAIWLLVRSEKESQGSALVEKTNNEIYPVQYLLPDSSTVFLGSGSKLSYPAQFTKTSRELHLSGEAFFDTKPDKDRPFTVHTRSMQTLVLGTSFKIEASDKQSIRVAVATGKVSVTAVLKNGKQNLGVLAPGYSIIFDELHASYRKGTTDITTLQQWTSGDLVFDEQPLSIVMQQLEKRYQVNIRFAEKGIAEYKVSGSFEKDQDLPTVLTMLSVIGKFKYKQQQNSIQLFK